jgi:hypothetical protein
VITQASQPAQNSPVYAENDLEELLALAEGGIDRETREFISEVLKFVPKEPEPEIQVFTSHLGASYAC